MFCLSFDKCDDYEGSDEEVKSGVVDVVVEGLGLDVLVGGFDD